MLNSRSLSRFALLLLILAVSAPVVAYAVVGTGSRLSADDWCYTVWFRDLGYAGYMEYLYQNWSLYYFSATLAGIIGVYEELVPLLPAILLGLWIVSSMWCLDRVGLVLKVRHRRLVAVVGALVIVYAILEATTNIYQTLYWLGASVVYVLPLVLLMAVIGVVIDALYQHRERPLPFSHSALCAGLVMLTGGCSALFAAYQVVILALTWLATWRFAPPSWRRNGLQLLGVMLAFALVALLFTALVPGNQIRQLENQNTLSITGIIQQTLLNTLIFLVVWTTQIAPFALLLLGVLSGFVAHQLLASESQAWLKRHQRSLLLYSTLGAVTLSAACFFTSAYSTGRIMPPRGFVVPQTALVALVMVWGGCIGAGLKGSAAAKHVSTLAGAGVLAVLILLGPVGATTRILGDADVMMTFAREWDARHAALTSLAMQGKSRATLIPFSEDLAFYLDVNTVDYVSAPNCIWTYYGMSDLSYPTGWISRDWVY